MLRFFSLFFFSLVCNYLLAQSASRFESEIRAFEQLDSIETPVQGQILLYGSSTMRLWKTYKQDLEGYNVVNRGFGGSELSDAIYYFDRVVMPLAPSLILFYEGDNDVSNGKKQPKQVLRDFDSFMQLIEQKLPDTRVAIYTVRPSIARENLLKVQRKLNKKFKKYCRKHRNNTYYIDVRKLLLTSKKKPNPELLAEDKLHLNAKGYEVWTKVTRDFLENLKI